jgi:hypothetical protein
MGKDAARNIPAPSPTDDGGVVGAPASSNSGLTQPGPPGGKPEPTNQKPRRFYGSVELDLDRPVKAFDAVLNAVIMELQRTPGAKLKITVEIEAEAANGFDAADVGVVRDNAKQLKFRSESTGFE